MSAPATDHPAISDPWTERQIRLGRLAPGARGLSRCEATRQYNAANALTSADPDFLYTPGAAQAAARGVLALVSIEIAPQTTIALTDARSGPWCATHRVTPGQVEAACEQHRQITGEHISGAALIDALPWV